MEPNRIRVGADPFPPYQYYLPDGTITGQDYEKITTLFQGIGLTADVVIKDWEVILSELDKGELEAAFQVQDTPERKKRFYFSDLFRNAVTEVVTSHPALKINSYGEIEESGLSLGVIEGYTNGAEIDALKGEIKKTYPNAEALLTAISRDEVDLGVFDRGVKEYIMANNRLDNIYAIESMTYIRPLYVIFNNADLRDTFNIALRAAAQS
ncbi:substrate-binding periplasmic protein [Syntrophomonas curvata]